MKARIKTSFEYLLLLERCLAHYTPVLVADRDTATLMNTLHREILRDLQLFLIRREYLQDAKSVTFHTSISKCAYLNMFIPAIIGNFHGLEGVALRDIDRQIHEYI